MPPPNSGARSRLVTPGAGCVWRRAGASTRRASTAPFPDEAAVTRALTTAVREAVLRHKALGQSIYALRDGKVVEIPAGRIRVPKR